MTRPDLDTYFINIATAVSARGDCLRDKVGCVIVDRMNRIISTGYNGARSGEPGCSDGACERGNLIRLQQSPTVKPGSSLDVAIDRQVVTLDCGTFHAEFNACFYIRPTHLGPYTAYVTRKPCAECRDLLADCGVGWVVYPNAATFTLTRERIDT